MPIPIRLGVNIDHIATVRNARGENDPSILEILFEVQEGGADMVTMHLREDRRHIKDEDVYEVKKHSKLPINLEMALTQEMVEIACRLMPSTICIVPEKREELTTEGGLDLKKLEGQMPLFLKELKKRKIEPYVFIEPDEETISMAEELKITGVELHTGKLMRLFKNKTLFREELKKFEIASNICAKKKISLHAGHGLNYHNIFSILHIHNLEEVNIGHAIVCTALKSGIRQAVYSMKNILNRKNI